MRAANLAATEPTEATALYREAFTEIDPRASDGRARRGARRPRDPGAVGARHALRGPSPGRERRRDARARHRPDRTDRAGRDDAAYYIDRTDSSVHRVDLGTGEDVEVVTRGDKAVSGNVRMGDPVQIETGVHEIVIVDDDARAWRWRPSNETGRGTLARLAFSGDTRWGSDHGDMETFSDSSGYRLYVVEPSQGQIARYQQTLDQSSFMEPSDYLITESEEPSRFRQLYIDGDLWALDDEGVQKYSSGRYEGGFMIAEPPDATDLRPGHDYQLVFGTGTDSSWSALPLRQRLGPARRLRQGDRRLRRPVGPGTGWPVDGGHARLLRRAEAAPAAGDRSCG